MKLFPSLLLALALFAPGPAGAGEAKAAYEVEVVKDVAYNTAADADAERHKLDLYLPKGMKGYPVFFFIHGGSWRSGNKNLYAPIGKVFAERGVGFVATNYRLSPKVKHPAHAEDVARAFAWVVGNVARHGGNPKQVYLGGHSAGGHLAALLATDESYLKKHKVSVADVKAVVPISGVYDVSNERLADRFGEDGQKASPMTHVKAKLPPFLVLYADKDYAGLGQQAEAFGEGMKKAKCDVEVRMIKGRDHISIIRNAAKADDDLTTAILAFVKKHNGGAAAK
jgi:acetyl esterase/lipase